MSNRYMNQLPYVALAVAALCAQQAHAAIQSANLSSIVRGAEGNYTTVFEIVPLQTSSVAAGTPIDIFFEGALTGSMRCRNVDGCGPVSLSVSAAFSFSFPGTSGSFWTPAGYPFPNTVTFTSYGTTEFGDYLDLKPIGLVSDHLTNTYKYAQQVGLISDVIPPKTHPPYSLYPLMGQLSFNDASIQPDSNSWSFKYDFDHVSFALVNPTFNIQYSAAVPEPGTYALLTAGLTALAAARRRIRKNAR